MAKHYIIAIQIHNETTGKKIYHSDIVESGTAAGAEMVAVNRLVEKGYERTDIEKVRANVIADLFD